MKMLKLYNLTKKHQKQYLKNNESKSFYQPNKKTFNYKKLMLIVINNQKLNL